MTQTVARRVRLLLAALMLLTGLLGQAGHAWAHGSGAGSAAAWLAALDAERDWLSGKAAAGPETAVQVFGSERPHSHGDGPAHQHQGPDGLSADHAHGVVFLPPMASAMPFRMPGSSLAWTLSAQLASALPGNPDRPPRHDAPLV